MPIPPFSGGPEGRVRNGALRSRARPSGPPLNGVAAYTLVELFLTLAVLTIVLGMMMNLADRVRRESCDKVTRQLLSRLTVAMAAYRDQNEGELPPVTPLLDAAHPANESALQTAAWQNDADTIRYLHISGLQIDSADRRTSAADPWAGSLSRSGSGPMVMKDPWGSPIVFMPQQNPAIGMAPGDVYFFFSAGADRQFLTREDNLYSYEESVGNTER